jgi:hypothetical protein
MTQKYLKYRVPLSTTTPKTAFINLARDLSAINRQLFRQTRTYRIKSIRVVDGDPDGSALFACAPHTWAMKNSLSRAYRRWNEMNAQVLKDQPSLKGKWNDFKPYLTYEHQQAARGQGGFDILVPQDIGGESLAYGDWQASVFESPDGTSSSNGYTVGLLGRAIGSPGAFEYVGLIESYGNTRNTIQDNPNVSVGLASEDPLLNLLDAGTQFDEVAANIMEENDLPPYATALPNGPGASYVGGFDNMKHPLQFGEVSSNDDRANPVFYNIDVPLGIVQIDHQTFTGTTSFTIIIEVASGDYKGVHSESLVDTRTQTWVSPSKGGKNTKRLN